jgi:lysozyme family protein
MGVSTSIKMLQRLLNAMNVQENLFPDLVVDGVLGSKSLNALDAYLGYRTGTGEKVLLKGLNCLQGTRYIELAEKRKQNEQFVYGWLLKRVNI